jgi:hypothetical protein
LAINWFNDNDAFLQSYVLGAMLCDSANIGTSQRLGDVDRIIFFVLNIIALSGGSTIVGLLSQSLSAIMGQADALLISLS